MILRQNPEIPSVHYIWVGPPSPADDRETGLGIERKNHDIDGPAAMANANKTNPVVFWCLREHVSAYQKKFSGKHIKVSCIEDYIEELQKSPDEKLKAAANKMKEILLVSLKDDARADKIPVRDRVTVKDAFSLFLHMTQKGALYTLDTNVRPTSANVTLPYYDVFRSPILTPSVFDCWALYSSAPNKNICLDSFDGYYGIWKNKARPEFGKNGYSLKYEHLLGVAIVESINNACENYHRLERPWETSASEIYKEDHIAAISSEKVTLSDLPLEKTYFNTHKLYNAPQIAQFKKPDLDKFNYADFENALAAIMRFIETHEWKLAAPLIKLGSFEALAGGKTIKTDSGQEKNVPDAVYAQWQLISSWFQNKSQMKPREVFEKVVEMGMSSARENDMKANSMFGARDRDTCSYFNMYFKLFTPDQYTTWFSSATAENVQRQKKPSESRRL